MITVLLLPYGAVMHAGDGRIRIGRSAGTEAAHFDARIVSIGSGDKRIEVARAIDGIRDIANPLAVCIRAGVRIPAVTQIVQPDLARVAIHYLHGRVPDIARFREGCMHGIIHELVAINVVVRGIFELQPLKRIPGVLNFILHSELSNPFLQGHVKVLREYRIYKGGSSEHDPADLLV